MMPMPPSIAGACRRVILNTQGERMLWMIAKMTMARTNPHQSLQSIVKPSRMRSAAMSPSAAENRKIRARMKNVITMPSVARPAAVSCP